MFSHSSRPARLAGGALFSVLLAGVLTACGETRGAGGPHGSGGPPPQVDIMVVQPQSLPVSFEYTGQTQGSREVEVRARVTGILVTRNYTEGSPVRAGQSLFTIDPVPFQTALARAEADRGAAHARHVNAQRHLTRVKPLADQGMVSKRDYDDALAAEQVAAADVKAADARVTEARLNLGYTRVVAPVSGLAGGAGKSEGSLVSGPDVLLTTIVQINPVKAVFGIPDAEHARMQADIKARRLVLPPGGFAVEVAAADGSLLAKGGKLQFSEPLVNSATGMVRSQAELPNGDEAIKPGQFVRVRLIGATRPDVVQVPQRAVMEGPQGKFVYVAAPSDKPEMKGAVVATSRPVQAGEWVDLPGGKGWVIREGLKSGDKVIVDGLMRIGPGAPVQIAQAPAAGASAPAQAASK
ncbi:efflux RND transporter periplasmic adaptor subunit [Caenimonas soli]|uniref:efflux RND transporter periplasmic adaptor subunit n=1 Tax=Caenimonas soli TaxID=2735555 RepID=UPI0015533CD0|nr:efflux RND transporter periplasmic adaptor subunit [Caenimonas soli]NPC54065.1 efflux RND transporter periplasmic adaptor subunit [Caenimonas soli]